MKNIESYKTLETIVKTFEEDKKIKVEKNKTSYIDKRECLIVISSKSLKTKEELLTKSIEIVRKTLHAKNFKLDIFNVEEEQYVLKISIIGLIDEDVIFE